MMNDDILRNIEYLREKADVSYEEAAEMLEKFDGNVMRVLVELERQGRVFPQGRPEYEPPRAAQRPQGHQRKQPPYEDVKKQATSAISRALQYRVVVESGTGEKKKTIADLSAPYVAGAAVIAPHLALPSVALMFLMGYRVKVKREKNGPMPEDIETFVDKTVSNIKQTASSFADSARTVEKEVTNKDRNDDDEGGEITIE